MIYLHYRYAHVCDTIALFITFIVVLNNIEGLNYHGLPQSLHIRIKALRTPKTRIIDRFKTLSLLTVIVYWHIFSPNDEPLFFSS